jgi:secondary thiamine-phosphate synthase enzyme
MKTHTDYLVITTRERYEIRDITDDVARIVATAEIDDGMVLISAMHITASVFVNDHEPGLWSDISEWLEKLAPAQPNYAHHRTGEDNADAHLKRMLLGHQVLLPITRGALDLGPWERVHYGEFDGRRPKRLVVKVMGATA